MEVCCEPDCCGHLCYPGRGVRCIKRGGSYNEHFHRTMSAEDQLSKWSHVLGCCAGNCVASLSYADDLDIFFAKMKMYKKFNVDGKLDDNGYKTITENLFFHMKESYDLGPDELLVYAFDETMRKLINPYMSDDDYYKLLHFHGVCVEEEETETEKWSHEDDHDGSGEGAGGTKHKYGEVLEWDTLSDKMKKAVISKRHDCFSHDVPFCSVCLGPWQRDLIIDTVEVQPEIKEEKEEEEESEEEEKKPVPAFDRYDAGDDEMTSWGDDESSELEIGRVKPISRKRRSEVENLQCAEIFKFGRQGPRSPVRNAGSCFRPIVVADSASIEDDDVVRIESKEEECARKRQESIELRNEMEKSQKLLNDSVGVLNTATKNVYDAIQVVEASAKEVGRIQNKIFELIDNTYIDEGDLV